MPLLCVRGFGTRYVIDRAARMSHAICLLVLLMVLLDFRFEFGVLKRDEAEIFQIALSVFIRIVIAQFT